MNLGANLAALVAQMRRQGVPYPEALKALQKTLIIEALRAEDWNRCAAAARLGMHRNTLGSLMERLKIKIRKDGRR